MVVNQRAKEGFSFRRYFGTLRRKSKDCLQCKNIRASPTTFRIPTIVVENWCTLPDDTRNGYDKFMEKHVRKAVTTSYVENVNSASDWNVLGTADEYLKDSGNFIKVKELGVNGSDAELELHKHFTLNEKVLLTKKRYKRRYAVDIENRDELKDQLTTFMSLIRFNFYWGK